MRSGIPCASALVTTSGAKRPVQSVKVGMGGTACMRLPSLALTSRLRKLPAQIGVSGVVTALKASRDAAIVMPIGTLMGPWAALSVAVQSMTIESPLMVTVTVSSTRSSVIPSEST